MVLTEATVGSMMGVMVNVGVGGSGIHHRRCWRRGLVHTLGVAVHGPVTLGLLLVAGTTTTAAAGHIMSSRMVRLSMMGAVIIIIWRRGLAVIEIWHRKGGRHVGLFAGGEPAARRGGTVVNVIVVVSVIVVHGGGLGNDSHGLVVQEEPRVHVFGFTNQSITSFVGI